MFNIRCLVLKTQSTFTNGNREEQLQPCTRTDFLLHFWPRGQQGSSFCKSSHSSLVHGQAGRITFPRIASPLTNQIALFYNFCDLYVNRRSYWKLSWNKATTPVRPSKIAMANLSKNTTTGQSDCTTFAILWFVDLRAEVKHHSKSPEEAETGAGRENEANSAQNQLSRVISTVPLVDDPEATLVVAPRIEVRLP